MQARELMIVYYIYIVARRYKLESHVIIYRHVITRAVIMDSMEREISCKFIVVFNGIL